MEKILDWNEYLETAAQAAAEGIVMLKNDNNALPLKPDEKISVFGRIQLHYYKSGIGSGGMVNVSKVTGIPDGLIESNVCINENLLGIYKKWDEENPFEHGSGWGDEPWAQKEMPLTDEIVSDAAAISSSALVIIGRTAGEELDAHIEKGSFLLTDTERDMLGKVRRYFNKVIVLLNTGGLIDLTDIENISPDALLLAWQGGMTGGKGCADVLTGKISPCGKLPDTIAYKIEDYPSHKYFGDKKRNFYTEDIYVGYRWFETFAPEKVRYPFGYGLSYTEFEIDVISSLVKGGIFSVDVSVRNIGKYSGKEVIQLYTEAPQGRLGKPLRMISGFEKTKTLAPDEAQTLTISVPMWWLASYDDTGITGHRFCNVLEEGEYIFYIGSSVKNIKPIYTVNVPHMIVTEKLSQALAPVIPFRRIKPDDKNGALVPGFEEVPLNEVNESERRLSNLPDEIPYTGDRGIKLYDVLNNKNSMEEFIAQLSDNDLACIIRGEGMGSPRVTAGTASAFGGVTDRLNELGIPAACCSDGPSGMRLDCGTKAFSLPNGTMLASTFNKELIEKLFSFVGLEMCANKVDCLLGPGINIHRHPLNGRNFEYFSEDPFLTGMMTAAELKGLQSAGVTGTIKHFCGNNQETNRHFLDSAVSERALREIYLKPFEIAVRDGGANSIMTTYGSLNGLWTAGNYDLNTTVLRNEWGFKGFTMTDWWANINRRSCQPDKTDFAAMAAAQNDVYMVCADGDENNDNTLASLSDNSLRRCELQRNAANICRFLLHTNAMKRMTGQEDIIKIVNRPDEDKASDEPVVFYDLGSSLKIDLNGIKSVQGQNYCFALTVNNTGFYKVTLTASSELGELEQMPVTIFAMGTSSGTFTWNGTGGKPVSFSNEVPLFSHYTVIRLYFAKNGLDLHSIEFELTRQSDNISDIAFVQED
ncbi:MAG: glycoside hydrolase family 3 protein [Ruminococcus sp.]|nr:glycoside hydrolase family 3 protein [Ruminococcus sp.]